MNKTFNFGQVNKKEYAEDIKLSAVTLRMLEYVFA